MTDDARECDWDERLQDWVDGDLAATEVAAVAQHAARCAICGERLKVLRALDAQLSGSVPRDALDASFDHRVLEHISRMGQADRAAARARLETERRDQLAALSRGWHRIWRSIILNGAACISLLIVLAVSLRLVPGRVSLLDRAASLTSQPGAALATAVAVAAVATVVGLMIVRALSGAEGG